MTENERRPNHKFLGNWKFYLRDEEKSLDLPPIAGEIQVDNLKYVVTDTSDGSIILCVPAPNVKIVINLDKIDQFKVERYEKGNLKIAGI